MTKRRKQETTGKDKANEITYLRLHRISFV